MTDDWIMGGRFLHEVPEDIKEVFHQVQSRESELTNPEDGQKVGMFYSKGYENLRLRNAAIGAYDSSGDSIEGYLISYDPDHQTMTVRDPEYLRGGTIYTAVHENDWKRLNKALENL